MSQICKAAEIDSVLARPRETARSSVREATFVSFVSTSRHIIMLAWNADQDKGACKLKSHF